MCVLLILISFPDYTVCEEYRCKPDEATCFHGYKVCEESSNGMLPYCSSSYTINNDLQLELLVKGCEYEVISDCTGSNECHVDNPLNGQENEFYMCCCNKSLCNQNETFTHPTEHFKYGEYTIGEFLNLIILVNWTRSPFFHGLLVRYTMEPHYIQSL